jgi:hypothetical protein
MDGLQTWGNGEEFGQAGRSVAEINDLYRVPQQKVNIRGLIPKKVSSGAILGRRVVKSGEPIGDTALAVLIHFFPVGGVTPLPVDIRPQIPKIACELSCNMTESGGMVETKLFP